MGVNGDLPPPLGLSPPFKLQQMPLPSSAEGCSPALLWHWFTLPVVSSRRVGGRSQHNLVRPERRVLQSLPQSLVPSFPLTRLSKVQACNWNRSSSAVSLRAVVPPCSPMPPVLVRSCLFALPAGVRQLFPLRQNVDVPVSCALQRQVSAAGFRLALSVSGLSLLFLGHSRELWYPSPHTAMPHFFFGSAAFLAIH